MLSVGRLFSNIDSATPTGARKLLERLYSQTSRGFPDIVKPIVDFQTPVLALGSTLTKELKNNTLALKEVPGGITNALKLALEAKTYGLPLNKSILNLASQMKYTGQSQTKLFEVLAMLRSQMSMSNSDLGDLSNNILKVGQHFGVTSDTLLEAVASLRNLELLNFSNMSKPILDAKVGLTAALGPSFSGPLNDLLQSILTEGVESYKIAGIAGIEDQVNQIQRGLNVEANLIEVFQKIAEVGKDFDTGDIRTNTIILDKLGRSAFTASKILNDRFSELGKNIPAEIAAAKKRDELLSHYTQSIAVSLDSIIDSFKYVGLKILSVFEPVLAFIGDTLKAIPKLKYALAGLTAAALQAAIAFKTASLSVGFYQKSLLAKNATEASLLVTGATIARVFSLISKLTSWVTLAITAIALLIPDDSETQTEQVSVLHEIAQNTGVVAEDIRSRNNRNTYQELSSDLINDTIAQILGKNETSLKQVRLLESIDSYLKATAMGVNRVASNTDLKLGLAGGALGK